MLTSEEPRRQCIANNAEMASRATQPISTLDELRHSYPQESSTVEFKREWKDDAIAKAVSAMSNSRGGVVLVGVDDKANYCGVVRSEFEKGRESIIDSITKKVRQLTAPATDTHVSIVDVTPPDRVVIVLKIPEHDHDVVQSASSHQYFIRCGNSSEPLTHEKLAALQQHRSGPSIQIKEAPYWNVIDAWPIAADRARWFVWYYASVTVINRGRTAATDLSLHLHIQNDPRRLWNVTVHDWPSRPVDYLQPEMPNKLEANTLRPSEYWQVRLPLGCMVALPGQIHAWEKNNKTIQIVEQCAQHTLRNSPTLTLAALNRGPAQKLDCEPPSISLARRVADVVWERFFTKEYW